MGFEERPCDWDGPGFLGTGGIDYPHFCLFYFFTFERTYVYLRKMRHDCTFFMITKRPERIPDHLPADWNDGWPHVTIAVTCENQFMADRRLPVYLPLPLTHHAVMVEPMLSRVNLRPFFSRYRKTDGSPIIESVSAGGESGPEARPCSYNWVLDLHLQCVENGVAFSYHQTGARLIKDGKEYQIPREYQHTQAGKACLDYDPQKGLLGLQDIPGE